MKNIEKEPFGTIYVPDGISVKASREFTPEETLKETYFFTNTGKFPRLTSPNDIGINIPFFDNCFTQIWCGGTSSYVMCLQMSGDGPHPGLVLTKGGLFNYSFKESLTLHPLPMEFEPGETVVLEWELFWHKGKNDFYEQILKYPSFVEIKTKHFVAFQGEDNQPEIIHRKEQDRFTLVKKIKGSENIYTIRGKNTETWCRTLELPPLTELAAERCLFIAEKQQYRKPGSALDGAYLAYNYKEEHIFYNYNIDKNICKEGIIMGALMARFLCICPNPQNTLTESLKNYLTFVLRELFDSKTGMVYDDILRSSPEAVKLDNFSWMAQFFLELHELWKENAFLRYAWLVMKKIYELGGEKFYPVNLPVVQMIDCFDKAGMINESEELKKYFTNHAGFILLNESNNPDILASAAEILMQAYIIFKEDKYFESGKKQMEIILLFSGMQPDYRLYGNSLNCLAYVWFQKAWKINEPENENNSVKTAEDSIRKAIACVDDQDWGLYYALRFLN